MAKQTVNNIKLGLFVLAGLLFLILLLYMIGKNRNLFGASFTLKARFENVQGLKPGNNVRYAGIEVGTVKKINIINDTLMEVVMTIEKKMKSFIMKNAVVSIGTDGFVGNKVVNIVTAKQPSPPAEDGDILVSKKPVDTDEMLRTFYKTNSDIATVAEELKATVQRVNNSTALWSVLNDEGLPKNLKLSASHIRLATARANDMVTDLHDIINTVRKGEGSLGALLTDTAFLYNLNAAIGKIKEVGDEADQLSKQIGKIASDLDENINSGAGPVRALLKDSAMVIKLNRSLDNIQQGTDAFNQNMEALKHNILFRGYFRRLEKQKKKETGRNMVSQ